MRLRLPASDGGRPLPWACHTPSPNEPITLFLPARNEAPRLGAVLGRCPDRVGTHPVRRVVVDDASSDGTAAVARAAGAEVIRLTTHAGLGAAVRIGLADAVAHRSAAVAFCDADGEYAPEQLPVVVAPILRGRADYVIGSRFLRDDRRMHVHREVGNRILTSALRYMTRMPITDGQSGYRALSGRAAAVAEIAHDYNYAQVLTLDLVSKGVRYQEVPITYAFRSSGRSFVRLGPYLRQVVPAALGVVNAARASQPHGADNPVPTEPATRADRLGDGLGERLAG